MQNLILTCDLICAAAVADGRPAFSLVAYNGGPMKLANVSRHPVVIDLRGLEVPTQKLPLRMSHDGETLIGHTEAIEVSATRNNASGTSLLTTVDLPMPD